MDTIQSIGRNSESRIQVTVNQRELSEGRQFIKIQVGHRIHINIDLKSPRVDSAVIGNDHQAIIVLPIAVSAR